MLIDYPIFKENCYFVIKVFVYKTDFEECTYVGGRRGGDIKISESVGGGILEDFRLESPLHIPVAGFLSPSLWLSLSPSPLSLCLSKLQKT